jgi:hypothetical protein
MKILHGFRLLFVTSTITLFISTADAQLDTGWIGAGDGRNVVRDILTVTNGTGSPANDLHALIQVRDPSAYIEEARGTTTQGSISGMLAGGPHPQSFAVNIVDIDVANGGNLTFGWNLDLNHLNQRWITWWWTHDGMIIGDPRGGNGHNVGGPTPGGNGGGGVGPGGGLGGQGGGGGTGFFVHPFTIYNDEDKEAVLTDFSLLASMTTYSDLGSIPWGSVDPINLGPFASVTLAPHSTFQFDFETTGAYADGHIYYKYTLTDDAVTVLGDHPVSQPVPEASTMATLAAAFCSLLGAKRLITRSRPAA